MKNVIDITTKQQKFTSIEEQEKFYWRAVNNNARDIIQSNKEKEKNNIIIPDDVERWLRKNPPIWITTFPHVFLTIKATRHLAAAIAHIFRENEKEMRIGEENWLATITGYAMAYDVYASCKERK